MGLVLPQKVKIDISGSMASYYENLGYKIPRYFNKRRNRYFVVNGTTIDVAVEDLKPNSNMPTISPFLRVKNLVVWEES